MDAKEKYKQCSYSKGIKDQPSTQTENDFHAQYLKKNIPTNIPIF
jgi:hypothetical protein